MELKTSFPTETIELPSKGLIYPSDNPLSSGVVEMKYMSAKEEDILTNQNYIKNNTVLDKLLQSMITSKIDIKSLIGGDKDALLISARILGYGKTYNFEYEGESYSIDLNELSHKEFQVEPTPGTNSFEFTFPNSGINITYKLLNGYDEEKIEQEVKSLQKLNKNDSKLSSTKLKFQITSVNGESDVKTIRHAVDNVLLAMDLRALREHIKNTTPGIDLKFTLNSGEEATIPITINFFWPDF